MKRIVLVQQKGGAAKTTLCVHLAVASEQSGSKTAIVDTDPQASAAQVWGQARGGAAPPVAQALAAELRDVLQAAEADGYQVVFIDTPPAPYGRHTTAERSAMSQPLRKVSRRLRPRAMVFGPAGL